MIYIIGTDTGVGKTYVSVLLLRKWAEQNLRTIALKPVASGTHWKDGRYKNEDAEILQKEASIPLSYAQVNPYCLNLPVSPHIAALKEKKKKDFLCVRDMSLHIQKKTFLKPDCFLIEGVGGLMVPLNEHETQMDLIQKLRCSVILVVGLKLGCLNHALLTFHVLKTHQIPVEGWIINHIDPQTLCPSENIETLKRILKKIPYLGYVPFQAETIYPELT